MDSVDKVYIIAEAGVNHNGSLDFAKKLIETAADAGADAVKFQTFIAEELVIPDAQKAEYQNKVTKSSETQRDMLKKLELSFEEHALLIDHCNKTNIRFLSTAFDDRSISFLKSLSLGLWKIPSGDITNVPYLRKIGSFNEEVILSTGMSYLHEVGFALQELINAGTEREKITVLHCNTEYPTPIEDVNLRAMDTIQNVFKVKVGFSDHTIGIEVSIAAAAMGATVIEKHFTLDREMEGPDHKASLEPNELKSMIQAIRNIEKALGDGVKEPTPSERKNIPIARKSIVAARGIKKGELFTKKNMAVKRPGTGLSPMCWDTILNSVSHKDYSTDEPIILT